MSELPWENEMLLACPHSRNKGVRCPFSDVCRSPRKTRRPLGRKEWTFSKEVGRVGSSEVILTPILLPNVEYNTIGLNV